MKPLRVLMTGGMGLLGKALIETVPEGCELLATYYRNRPPAQYSPFFHPLDIRESRSVRRLFEDLRPDGVIHTASMGSVDEAERDPRAVREVNVEGTKNVGEASRVCRSVFLFISSNAVFDGLDPPYSEESPVHAINRYGALKVEAENWVRNSGLSYLILRPILMYGWPWPGGRGNVVTRWLENLQRGLKVEVANDITSMPLLAENCAQAIWAALRAKARGILHVAGADRVSLVKFATETARIFGHEASLIRAVPSHRLSTLAPRPRDTSFVTTRIERELGIRPMGLVEGLTQMLRSRVPNVGVVSREPIRTA